MAECICCTTPLRRLTTSAECTVEAARVVSEDLALAGRAHPSGQIIQRLHPPRVRAVRHEKWRPITAKDNAVLTKDRYRVVHVRLEVFRGPVHGVRFGGEAADLRPDIGERRQ